MASAPSGLDAASAPSASSMPAASLAAAQSGSSQICPDCGTPRATPTATFCEVCRYNFVTQTSWNSPKVPDQPAPAVVPPIAAPSSAAPSVNAAVFPAPTIPPASSGVVNAPAASPAANAPDATGSGVIGSGRMNAGANVFSDANPTPAQPGSVPSCFPDSGLTQAPILRWEAVMVVDPSLNVDPDPNLPCPTGEPERVFPLDFADNLIGRRSDKRDIHPEITVNDPCASHRHAKLQRQQDGSFTLLDVGSTNGTQLNGVDVQPGVRTPLSDGDQITLGCWTRITIRGLRS
jgi:FHA domain